LIERLQLDSLVETEAILADGSKVTLETFVCFGTGLATAFRCKSSPTTVGFLCLALASWSSEFCTLTMGRRC
jgi:hypothetical protein